MMPPSDKLGVLKAQWEKGRKKEKKKEREGGREGGWHVPSPQLAYMLMRPKLHFKELFTFFFLYLCCDSANLPTARSCTFYLFIL